MERQGRWDEALAAYLKVIDRRGDAAPESNLDAGLIYLNHIKDPIYAIYYFRRYLELEPNSKQAVYVKGLIDAAKREFARALPGQPLRARRSTRGSRSRSSASSARTTS
jgi:tetratricopeptide (TPR) repeat protein